MPFNLRARETHCSGSSWLRLVACAMALVLGLPAGWQLLAGMLPCLIPDVRWCLSQVLIPITRRFDFAQRYASGQREQLGMV
jgi:hypothetical protein